MRTPSNTSVFIAVVVSGLALISPRTAANAAPGAAPKAGIKPGEPRGNEKLIQDLKLTDAQKKSAKVIEADARKQRKAIAANPALTPDQKKSQTRTLMMSRMGKFMALLTPDQKTMLMNKMMQTKHNAVPTAPKL